MLHIFSGLKQVAVTKIMALKFATGRMLHTLKEVLEIMDDN